jgi:type IV pilus assembly protein PilW
MLGGAGYAEVPTKVSSGYSSGTTVQVGSTVGFAPAQWVLVGAGLGQCLITSVSGTAAAPAAPWPGSNAALTVTTASSGSKSIAAGDYLVDLGSSTAASFLMFAVDGNSNSLQSIDLLNTSLAVSQNVSDDIVFMRAVYQVQPATTDALTWTNPATGVALTSGTYDYSSAGLLAGTVAASTALSGIKAIRVAVVVRAPINEKLSNNVPTSLNLFSSLSSDTTATSQSAPSTCTGGKCVTWYVPSSTNYRYRVIETTIPIRNNGLL